MSQARSFVLCFLAVTAVPQLAWAVKSAELYTGESYRFGRVEARVRYAAGDGVVSSFFLWKDGSEIAGTFWNELDFEKLGAACSLETNAFFGNPAAVHTQRASLSLDLCGQFHTYTYEWTPDYIAWLVDGMEIRRETGATATAYAENAPIGMQIRFNVWPGDASFGGNFNPAILPVHQYIDWVQYSTYADGVFTVAWRDDFDGATLASRWLTGSWGSPKNLSTHDARNVNVVNGYAVLSLTADEATGPGGANPEGGGNTAGAPGSMPEPPAQPEPSDGDGCAITPGSSGRAGSVFGAFAIALGLLLRRSRRALGR